MILHFGNKNVKFELGKTYSVSLKNGTHERFKVIGFHNPTCGKPSIRVINQTWGWTQYIAIANILSMS